MDEGIQLGIVVSQFNWDIVEPLLNATFEQLKEKGIEREDVLVYEVPGALEIPAVVSRAHPLHDAFICLGAVVRGETSHYDIVSENASRSLMDLSLSMDVPVINGILCVENKAQGLARVDRGAYFADAAIEMAILYSEIDENIDDVVGDLDIYSLFEEN